MSEFLLLEYPTTGSISEPKGPFNGSISYGVSYNFLVLKIQNIILDKKDLKFVGNIEEIRVITSPTYNVSGHYDAKTLEGLSFINSGYTSNNVIMYRQIGNATISNIYRNYTIGNVTFNSFAPMPYETLSELETNIGLVDSNLIYDTRFPLDGMTFDIYSVLKLAYSAKDFSLLNIDITTYDDKNGLQFARSLIETGYGTASKTIIGEYSTVGMPKKPDASDSDYADSPDSIESVPKPDVNNDGEPTPTSVGTTIFQALLTGNTAYYAVSAEQLNNFWQLFWGIPDIQTIILNSLTGMFDSLSKCVLGVQLYPFDMSKYCTTVTSAPVVGRYVLDTNLPRITSFNNNMNMGSFDFGTYKNQQKHFGSKEKPHFLDYAPYTTFKLYLPFVNNVIELDTNVWQYSTLDITLSVDLTTGRGLYTLIRSNVPIQYIDCKVGIDVPFVLDDMISTVSNATKGIVKGVASGNVMDVVDNVNFPPLDIRSEISDATAYLGSLRARVTISQAIPRYPTTFAKTIGYKTYTSKKLGDIKGFVVIDNPVLDMSGNMTVTEYEMIINKLQEGVYL